LFDFIQLQLGKFTFLQVKAVCIAVTLQLSHFERHLICGAYLMKIFSTATLTIATCVLVQNIEIRKGGFVKPDNKTQPNSIRKATTNFFMSFSCHPDKYLTQQRILKLFNFL